MVRFSNILVADPPACNVTIPEGLIAVDHPHITLLSNELSREVRATMRGRDLASLPAFPEVTFGEPYIAETAERRTLVCDCIEQDAIRAWVESAVAALGIPVVVDPSRVYHISVANTTGSQFNSIPDPWNHRA